LFALTRSGVFYIKTVQRHVALHGSEVYISAPMVAQSSEYSAFICYATPDSGKAQEICARLEAHGLRCWIAPRDVRAGREYANEIITGIERSRCLVLVLSVAANESQFVGREVERAVTKGRPVVPVRIEPVLPSPGLELFVSATQWIDAWSGDCAVSAKDGTANAPWSARRVLSGAAAFALVGALAGAGYWYGTRNGERERPADPPPRPATGAVTPPVQVVGAERLTKDASDGAASVTAPISTATSRTQVTTRPRESESRTRIVQSRGTAPPPAAQPVAGGSSARSRTSRSICSSRVRPTCPSFLGR
jgi:hypothetical protein